MNFKSLLALSALLVLMAVSCKKASLESLSEGMTFSFSPEGYLTHKLNVNVANGNNSSSTVPDATIRISGPDADKVFEINGGTKMILSEQMARMVVNPGQKIEADNPLRFTIEVSAPGFLPMSREVLVGSLDTASTYTMGLIEKNAPPKGISLINRLVDVPAGAGGISSPFEVQVPAQGSVAAPQQSRLKVADGTRFLDKAGNAISGSVDVELVHYNHTEEYARVSRPQNVTTKSVTVSRNGSTKDITFLPMAEMDIHMRSGAKEVKSFSKPISGQIDIDAKTLNLSKGSMVQAGDMVDIYSLSDGDNVWKYETSVALKAGSPGKLVAEFPINHLSTYAAVPPFNDCPRKLQLSFNKYCATGSVKKNYNSSTLHYITIHEAGVPGEPILASFENVPVDNGEHFTLPNPLPEVAVIVRVWEYDTKAINDQLNGRVVGEALNVAKCANNVKIILNVPLVTGRDIMSFKIISTCLFEGKKIRYAHDGRVQFRLYNDPNDPWRDMGISKNGDLVTDRLDWNVRYLFKTIIVGKVQGRGAFEAVERTRPRAPKKIEFNNIPGGSSFWTFARNDWAVPEEECESICVYFGY